jgi:catechol 2,3-dioxygenase-like lactoylglutathione lyase family enzyme
MSSLANRGYNSRMHLETIDTLSIASEYNGYDRLGLRRHSFEEGPPTLHVGRGDNAVGLMHLNYKQGVPANWPVTLRRGLFAVGIKVDDLQSVVDRLAEHEILAPNNGESAWLLDEDRAGATLFFSTGLYNKDFDPGHAFPLKRLDHLAAIAYDLDKQCRFWEDVLGVPVTGEVRTPHMIIRQLRIGNAIFELLGPAGPDSPLHQRPAGLVSMAAWEVDDLPAVVEQARAAGFTVPDPAIGVLPGTRTATIPANELGGMAMQLLQYV